MALNKQRLVYLGVFLLSSALLAFEVLAVRLISILFYPIATYLVISLALLGFGISGGLLAIRKGGEHPSKRLAVVGAIGFSLTLLLAFVNIWFAHRGGLLSITLLISMGLPFAFGGMSIAIVLSLREVPVHAAYFSDLLGAGVGVGLLLLGLNVLDGIQMGGVLAALGVSAAALFAESKRYRALMLLVSSIVLLASVLIQFPNGIIPISPKELALMSQKNADVRWEAQKWSPLARVDVLSLPGDDLPSVGATEYKLVTQDGGAPTILLHFSSDLESVTSLRQSIFGLPYWIKKAPSILIIGLGGGPDVQAALNAGARKIIGLEVNARMIELVRDTYAEFVGEPYRDPRVTIVQGDGRHFVQKVQETFDVIQLTGVDTSVASLGANPNLSENYLYTVEAFDEFLNHLNSDGLLSVSFPNVEGLGLRLTAMAAKALQRHGVERPQDHLVITEITGFVHVLVKRSPFTDAEVMTLQNHFDQAVTALYFPLYNRLFGVPEEDFFARSEILHAPGWDDPGVYTDFYNALADGDEAQFLKSQAQNVLTPTDDRPFFFVLDKIGGRAVNMQTLGLTLGVLTLAACVLMIVPPLILSRRGLKIHEAGRFAGYFLALGLGYIFVEVNLIQKYSLFLGHPSYSLAITLCTMLVSSGLGSLVGGRWQLEPSKKIRWVTLGIGGMILLDIFFLDPLFRSLLGLPLGFRISIAVFLAACPAFLMGMPFPTALQVVKERAGQFVPWAWAINGTASVMSTVLGVIIAIAWGFNTVFFLSMVLYIFAGLIFPRAEG
jgi:spermidine synthase